MTVDDLTLAHLKLSNRKVYDIAIQCLTIDSYEAFLKVIYNHLEWAVNELQEHPNQYGDMNEDQITQTIISILRAKEVNAYSDPDTGGHVDLRIDYPGTNYLWLGEAKIDLNPGHVFEGFQQLTTRYATAARNQTEGGILIYVKSNPLMDYMEATKVHLNDNAEQNIDFCECSRWPEQAFIAKTPIKRMGGNAIYNVRYIGISLYFLPEDKSGRTARKFQEKRSYIESKQELTKPHQKPEH